MRNAITLACTDCKQRNYQTNKNTKNNPDRIERMKYEENLTRKTVR